MDFVSAVQLRACEAKFKSPCSLLNKRVYKFKIWISKIEIYYFTNFKIPFTRKSWLLKFGFAYSLAQILEPKLLAHEILKFT